MKLICLDAEFADAHEILELAIFDFNEHLIYNSLFKPATITQWKSSQRIHHISPEMVRNKPSFAACSPEIQRIVDEADFIVGFAVDNDIRMLEKSGIERLDKPMVVDVRDVYWHCHAKGRGVGLNSVPGLAVVAEDLGISFGTDREHSAGGDTLVTLRCLRAMMQTHPEAATDPEKALRELLAATDTDKRIYRRENAKGYVHLLLGPRGYSLRPSTHARIERRDVVATIAVDHRDRAEADLLQHFSPKAVRGERRLFNLRDRDISYFKSYTNTYDEENADLYRMFIKRY